MCQPFVDALLEPARIPREATRLMIARHMAKIPESGPNLMKVVFHCRLRAGSLGGPGKLVLLATTELSVVSRFQTPLVVSEAGECSVCCDDLDSPSSAGEAMFPISILGDKRDGDLILEELH